ncbi:hypothetical protein [Carnobacterium jeotgali]
MNIEEFKAEKQAKMDRVANLRNEVATNKDKLKEAEQDYNTALADGNDTRVDELFPKLTELKRLIAGSEYKLDKLETLNKESLKANAEKTFQHLKEVKAEYDKKAKLLDDKMKPIEKQALKLLLESDDLVNEYHDIRSQYVSLAENYGIRASNISVPRYNALEVFKETGVRVNGYGVVAEQQVKASPTPQGEKVVNEHLSNAEFAAANRIIGGK